MGVALFAVAKDRRRSTIAILVGASLAADVAWCVLTLVGIEGGRSLGSQSLHAPRLPWSHSLASTAVLAIVFAAAAAALADRASRMRLAILAAVAVVVHWVVGDLPFGEGFPITPGSEPIAGPHLYARWPIAFAIEVVTVACGVAVAAAALGRRRAVMLVAALSVLNLIVWVPTFAGRATIDLDVEPAAITGYLVLLVVAWVVCVAAVSRTRDALAPSA